MNENEQVLGTDTTMESAADGAQLAPVQEASEAVAPISSLVEDAAPVEAQAAEPAEVKEPGWFKGRLEKALRKQREQIDAEWRERLAPIYNDMNERKAQALVDSGEFKSLETAREYVNLKGGNVPFTEQPAPTAIEQPRDDNGRFAAAPKADQTMATMLAHQAKSIEAKTGLDVVEQFKSADRETQAAIMRGDMDFYDFAESLQGTAKRTPPKTMTTPNGQVGNIDIMNMSAEQFAKLNANLAAGMRYDARK